MFTWTWDKATPYPKTKKQTESTTQKNPGDNKKNYINGGFKLPTSRPVVDFSTSSSVKVKHDFYSTTLANKANGKVTIAPSTQSDVTSKPASWSYKDAFAELLSA